MILSRVGGDRDGNAVYQRGWMIDSQLAVGVRVDVYSISKGMDD